MVKSSLLSLNDDKVAVDAAKCPPAEPPLAIILFELTHNWFLFFLIYLVYYSTFIEFENAHRSISILTTTFLSAIALYFSVEKPEPKKLTIVDLIFIWFYLINGITILAYGSASFVGLEIFYWVVLMLKIAIPLSLITLSYHLYERIKRNRESIILDRDV